MTQSLATGIDFIWAISLGQILSIGFSSLGIVGGIIALVVKVGSHGTSIVSLNKSVDALRSERHNEGNNIREDILMLRQENNSRFDNLSAMLTAMQLRLPKETP